MNCLGMNIRGMGVIGKDEWVRGLRMKNDVAFLMLQETKVQGLDIHLLERFWGRGTFDFEVVEPTGLSGGLVSMWNKSCFEKEAVLKNRNFLLVSGHLKDVNMKINVVNVYGQSGTLTGSLTIYVNLVPSPGP